MMSALERYVHAWLQKAENDLQSAQRLLEIEPLILDTACFHCQQATEKYLKAFLVYHDIEVEKTHDVIFLLKECSMIDAVFSTIDPININIFAVHARYPDDSIVPTPTEAKRYYQLALQVKTLVTERIILP